MSLDKCGSFKAGVIPNDRKEFIIRDVQRGKLWGFPISL